MITQIYNLADCVKIHCIHACIGLQYTWFEPVMNLQ